MSFLAFLQGSLVVNHGLGQHCFDQLVHVPVWLVVFIARDTIRVYTFALVQSVLHFFRKFAAEVQGSPELFVHFLRGLLLENCPVENDVAGPLVPQLQGARAFLVGSSPENKQCFLALLDVLVVLAHERVLDIDFSSGVNLLLHVLIEHHIAHVFDVHEVLLFEQLNDSGEVLLLDPNENKAVLHNFGWNLNVLAELFN